MARESKESIHEKILSAAEKRFWHYGIKKTTIDEIAADADVGKGTVYLHFESKEEIAIAIILQFKQQQFADQEKVVQDTSIPVIERLKRVLSIPVQRAHEYCDRCPMVIEMVSVLKPHFPERLRSQTDKEIDLVRQLIEEGNATGVMHVADVAETARRIKLIVTNYMPGCNIMPFIDDPVLEIGRIVDLIYQGLR